ncbi:MAG TPA: hypothetical protein VIU64_06745, partial [Polyangia bacterium]
PKTAPASPAPKTTPPAPRPAPVVKATSTPAPMKAIAAPAPVAPKPVPALTPAPAAAKPGPAPITAPMVAKPEPVPVTTPVVPKLEPAPLATAPAVAPPPSVAPHAPFLIAPPLPPPEAGPSSGSAPAASAPRPAPAPSDAPPANHVTSQPEPAGADIAVKRAATEAGPSPKAPDGEPSGRWSYAPRAKLAYRRFGFSRMPVTETSATGVTTTAAPADESFESLSLDLYPMSSYMRIGFSSQFGWESGQFQRTGDYFLAESATLGIQWPGRFTPFAEALAGGGYMRRKQGTTDKPSAYWQLGIDAGVEIYFANRAYGSLALGYLRPGNLFYADKSLGSVKLDTWSLKVGIGI